MCTIYLASRIGHTLNALAPRTLYRVLSDCLNMVLRINSHAGFEQNVNVSMLSRYNDCHVDWLTSGDTLTLQQVTLLGVLRLQLMVTLTLINFFFCLGLRIHTFDESTLHSATARSRTLKRKWRKRICRQHNFMDWYFLLERGVFYVMIAHIISTVSDCSNTQTFILQFWLNALFFILHLYSVTEHNRKGPGRHVPSSKLKIGILFWQLAGLETLIGLLGDSPIRQQ